MRARTLLVAALLLIGASVLWAHDMFLKLDTYFLAPNTPARVLVLNGTFQVSENGVDRERLADLSVVSPGGIAAVAPDAWSVTGDSTWLALRTGSPGTYVVGASILPRELSLSADDFNQYLEHDAIPDVLDERRRTGELDQPARERYSKHVKAVFQVGEERSDGFATPLGYPAEIVPLVNPYGLRPGDQLRVRCLVDGRAVANQTVVAGGEGKGGPLEERRFRTDAHGVVRLVVDRPGKWYVKFINMVRSPEEGFDYESKWATLTFEVR